MKHRTYHYFDRDRDSEITTNTYLCKSIDIDSVLWEGLESYRVCEAVGIDDIHRFYPEEKRLWFFWVPFNYRGEDILFYTLDGAKAFIFDILNIRLRKNG